MMEGTTVRHYLAALERLTVETLDDLDRFLAEDVRFVDPFHDVRGRDRMRRVLAKMFVDLDQVRFVVGSQACQGQIGFASWTLTGVPRSPRLKSLVLRGVTEIHLGEDGRVTAHIDHWDAASQLYEQIPLLGRVMATVRRRLAGVTA